MYPYCLNQSAGYGHRNWTDLAKDPCCLDQSAEYGHRNWTDLVILSGVVNFMPIDLPPLYLPGKYRSPCGIMYYPGPGVGLQTDIRNRSANLAVRPLSKFGM